MRTSGIVVCEHAQVMLFQLEFHPPGDLRELFEMIDTDGSGTIGAAEFIKPLSRWCARQQDGAEVHQVTLSRGISLGVQLFGFV